MIRILAAIVALVISAPASVHAQGYPDKVGVNLEPAGSGAGMYADLMKDTWKFMGIQGVPFRIDEHGWPTTDCRKMVFDTRPVSEWTGVVDDPLGHRPDMEGVYKCSLVGSVGHISINSGRNYTQIENLAYDEAENLTTFDLVVGPPGPGRYIIGLTFTGTRRTPDDPEGTGFTDLKIMRPGHTEDELFSKDFIALLDSVDFAAIRYMPLTETNEQEKEFTFPETREWSDRKLPTDASQGPRKGSVGVCWEHVIEIANLTRSDPWINVPIAASPDYVRQLAELFKAELDPSLNVYVELSNEVWNFTAQKNYSTAQAASVGMTGTMGVHRMYARRALELAQIFGEVWGEEEINNRVRVVLASHRPMLKWWVEDMLDHLTNRLALGVEDGVEPPKPSDYIYAISCQTYFRATPRHLAVDQDTIFELAKESIDEQTHGFGPGSDNSGIRRRWVAVARQYGLVGGVVSYEGGPHFPSGSSQVNLDELILANYSPRMGEALIYNYKDNWLDVGGGLFMHHNLYSRGSYARFGAWGATHSVSEPNSPKLAALRSLASGEPYDPDGFPVDPPVEPEEPTDPTDPEEPTDPEDPVDPPDEPEEPTDPPVEPPDEPIDPVPPDEPRPPAAGTIEEIFSSVAALVGVQAEGIRRVEIEVLPDGRTEVTIRWTIEDEDEPNTEPDA